MLKIGVESPTEISEADRISLRDQASKAAYQIFPYSPAQEITSRLLLYLQRSMQGTASRTCILRHSGMNIEVSRNNRALTQAVSLPCR